MKKNNKQTQTTIHALLSNQLLRKLANKEYSIVIPHGVQMKHSRGSKWLIFYCPNSNLSKLMEDALDNEFITWQKY